jgi:aryl-alcohol dehydrogenase-like predicted oxidoreductase
MKYRTLGRTGLRVSEISLGTSQTFRVAAREDERLCVRIVHEALDRGINFFDTAPNYWEAERVLGIALEGRRDEAIVATKINEKSAAAARESIERSFDNLRTDVIDLMQIHSLTSWREVTPVIQEYQHAGRVRFIGLTASEPDKFPEMLEAMRTGTYDTIQIIYSLAERSCREEVLPLAREMNIGVIALRVILHLLAERIPLRPEASTGSGNDSGAEKPMKLARAHAEGRFTFLDEYGVRTAGQALFKYVLSHPAVSTIIAATGKIERIAENAAASDGIALPPEACARLEGLLA